jgi:hypothetical protein
MKCTPKIDSGLVHADLSQHTAPHRFSWRESVVRGNCPVKQRMNPVSDKTAQLMPQAGIVTKDH